MMPTSGTITTSLKVMRWMNHTKIHVPKIAAAKANSARPHRVEFGMNRSASKMPNCAEEIVAPVVGETNLFIHSCCIIRPATLMPTPVHRIASRRGNRETRSILSCSRLPPNSSPIFRSITPTNREATDKNKRQIARTMEMRWSLMLFPLFSCGASTILAIANIVV